jgi:hypothetical protein
MFMMGNSMEPRKLATISLTWDLDGNVSHVLDSPIPLNDYKRDDAIGLSAVLAISGQLGALAPIFAIELCSRTVRFLNFEPNNLLPIMPPLSGAQIDLVWNEPTIVATFHPATVNKGSMDIEEAVCRLLPNYLYHIEKVVVPEIVNYLRTATLMPVLYYLSEVLSPAAKNPWFKPQETNASLMLNMAQFTSRIYQQWKGGPTLPQARYKSKLFEAQKLLKSIARQVGSK